MGSIASRGAHSGEVPRSEAFGGSLWQEMYFHANGSGTHEHASKGSRYNIGLIPRDRTKAATGKLAVAKMREKEKIRKHGEVKVPAVEADGKEQAKPAPAAQRKETFFPFVMESFGGVGGGRKICAGD